MKTQEDFYLSNEKKSVNHFKELMKNNFDENDFEMILNYSRENYPIAEEQAIEHIQKLLRKLYKRSRCLNIPLKYLWILDWESNGKLRFRLFVKQSEAVTADYLSIAWRKGGYILRHFDTKEINRFATTIKKERPTYRRYNVSKNLI